MVTTVCWLIFSRAASISGRVRKSVPACSGATALPISRSAAATWASAAARSAARARLSRRLVAASPSAPGSRSNSTATASAASSRAIVPVRASASANWARAASNRVAARLAACRACDSASPSPSGSTGRIAMRRQPSRGLRQGGQRRPRQLDAVEPAEFRLRRRGVGAGLLPAGACGLQLRLQRAERAWRLHGIAPLLGRRRQAGQGLVQRKRALAPGPNPGPTLVQAAPQGPHRGEFAGAGKQRTPERAIARGQVTAAAAQPLGVQRPQHLHLAGRDGSQQFGQPARRRRVGRRVREDAAGAALPAEAVLCPIDRHGVREQVHARIVEAELHVRLQRDAEQEVVERAPQHGLPRPHSGPARG